MSEHDLIPQTCWAAIRLKQNIYCCSIGGRRRVRGERGPGPRPPRAGPAAWSLRAEPLGAGLRRPPRASQPGRWLWAPCSAFVTPMVQEEAFLGRLLSQLCLNPPAGSRRPTTPQCKAGTNLQALGKDGSIPIPGWGASASAPALPGVAKASQEGPGGSAPTKDGC